MAWFLRGQRNPISNKSPPKNRSHKSLVLELVRPGRYRYTAIYPGFERSGVQQLCDQANPIGVPAAALLRVQTYDSSRLHSGCDAPIGDADLRGGAIGRYKLAARVGP